MYRSRTSSWSTYAIRISLSAILAGGLWFLVTRYSPFSNQLEGTFMTPEGTKALLTTEVLYLTYRLDNPEGKLLKGKMHLELLTPEGAVIADRDKKVELADKSPEIRFEMEAPRLPPEQITLQCNFQKQKFIIPLIRILTLKPHETSLGADTEFLAESLAALRCGVHGVKGLFETVPFPGADVQIDLRSSDNKITTLYKGRTNEQGWTHAEFIVPSLAPGQYTLRVSTRSDLGVDKLEHPVQIHNAVKVRLDTDKPVYQPGQIIHIRAMTLRPFDLKPVSDRELVLEIQDAKGNKVFKRPVPTTGQGIAAVDFPLAEEANLGDYRIRAILANQQVEKTVAVRSNVQPKLQVNLTTEKTFFFPKESIHGQVQADDLFGKPVAGGRVEVAASTFDLQSRTFQSWEGETDENGRAKFSMKLPDYFIGQALQKGNALVRLEVKVTDSADRSASLTRSFPVSDQPIRVILIPEDGKLLPDVENKVYVATLYQDGTPASCNVILRRGKDARGQVIASTETDATGLADFHFTPFDSHFRKGPLEKSNRKILGGKDFTLMAPKKTYDFLAAARDSRGNTAQTLLEINGESSDDNVLLHLDKALYRAGESLRGEVLGTGDVNSVFLDVRWNGQTVLTRHLEMKLGKASFNLELPAGLFGTLEIHAYDILGNGEFVRASRVVYVQPREDWKNDVKLDKDVHLPSAAALIRLQVTDPNGTLDPGALRVIIGDESVYALQEMQPGLEKVYIALQKELLAPPGQAIDGPLPSIESSIPKLEISAKQQQVARILLAPVRVPQPGRWDVAPSVERVQKVAGQMREIVRGLLNYALANRQFMDYDRSINRWNFKPALLRDLVDAHFVDPSLLIDPFGSALALDDFSKFDPHFKLERIAESVTYAHMQQIIRAVVNYSNADSAKFLKNGKWIFPPTIIEDAAKHQKLDGKLLKDAWGEPIQLRKRKAKLENQTGVAQFDNYDLVSKGPDRVFDSADDLYFSDRELKRRLDGNLFHGVTAAPPALSSEKVNGTSGHQ